MSFKQLNGGETSSIRVKALDVRVTRMQFVLVGFKQDIGHRVFAFECVGPDGIRAEYTVRADLGLTRTYGIQMQELPLLCRGLLERREGDGQYTVTFTEDEMRLHANTCKEARNAALLKRKTARRPTITNQTGIGWRAPQPHPS